MTTEDEGPNGGGAECPGRAGCPGRGCRSPPPGAARPGVGGPWPGAMLRARSAHSSHHQAMSPSPSAPAEASEDGPELDVEYSGTTVTLALLEYTSPVWSYMQMCARGTPLSAWGGLTGGPALMTS